MADEGNEPDHDPDAAVPGTSSIAVVGIAASGAETGSLERLLAASALLRHAAIVVMLQRSEDLTEQRRMTIRTASALDLVEIADGMAVEPGRVHLAPPRTRVTLDRGRFLLREAGEDPGGRGAVDGFLVSLAGEAGERAVAVVLAGIGSDGTLGLTAVRENGGLALAESDVEGDDGSFNPKAATAVADIVGPVEDLVHRIAAQFARVGPEADGSAGSDDIGAMVSRIAAVLRNRTGHDFEGYKPNTFQRRVQRRMQVTQTRTPEAYLDLLRSGPDEARHLFHDLLIGVTHFFRDGREFEALERTVVPRIFEGKGAADSVRIWVPGCATGEEAYSIAILLREHMARLDTPPQVQIFATDIDTRALAKARIGRYAASAVQAVAADRLARWFVKEGDSWCVVKDLREMCIFSQHNLIKDAPFSRIDLVSCRNLLIYLNAELQARVVPLFHFALRPGGFLFLGNSENVTRHGTLFAPVDRRFRLFRRSGSAARAIPDIPLSASAERSASPGGSPGGRATSEAGSALAGQAERIMERYAPAYLIVDENHDVLHFSGRTGRFLEPQSGLASLNVYNLIHRDLRMDLRSALHAAATSRDTVRVGGLRVGQAGRTLLVTLSVEPLDAAGDHPQRFAVVFQDGVATDDDGGGVITMAGGRTDEHVQRLEEELRLTRDRLQATIEELESTNEELKASNEEYQSVNEELQSSNEEIETSKEELQSLNEELQTVNGELAHRVEELARSNSDLKNLFESTQIATIFLDNGLRITSFTPAMTDILHLIDSDIGRPIHHIAKKIAYEDLENDVRKVVRTLTTIERETVNPRSQSRYLTRILPYRSIANVIEGAVVTFLDVTPLSRAEERLRESEARLRAIVEGIPQLVWRASAGGRWTWASPQWAAFTGQAEAEALGLGWLEMVAPEDRPAVLGAWARADQSGALDVEHRLWHAAGGAFRSVHLRATPLRGDDGGAVEWFGTASDIDDLTRLQDRQQVLLHELQHRVRNILALVRSVALRTARTSEDVQGYARTLEGRINAMARTQNVLTSAPDATIALSTILRDEIEANGGEIGGAVTLSGPDVILSGKAAESLTLALHELSTNAAKYGALATPEGRLAVTWTVEAGPAGEAVALVWQESAVPRPVPGRRGFGSELVENVVPYELGGTGKLEFGSDGIRCLLGLPVTADIRLAPSGTGAEEISKHGEGIGKPRRPADPGGGG